MKADGEGAGENLVTDPFAD
jgi:hypothetical protein